MVQVLDEIFRNPSDQTRVTLLCFHTSSADVLLREKLDAYSAAHGDRFRCVFVTDKKEEGVSWVAESGYATQEMLKQYMPAPAADTLIYTCGQWISQTDSPRSAAARLHLGVRVRLAP